MAYAGKPIPVQLLLTMNTDISKMPGSEGYWTSAHLHYIQDVNPPCLVVDTSGYFDVVSYLYRGPVGDLENIRHFTNGDIPRPETDFAAWALLPDLT